MSENSLGGKVTGVNGNMVSVAFTDRVTQNEVAYVITDKERLKSEVIRARSWADIRVCAHAASGRRRRRIHRQMLSVERRGCCS